MSKNVKTRSKTSHNKDTIIMPKLTSIVNWQFSNTAGYLVNEVADFMDCNRKKLFTGDYPWMQSVGSVFSLLEKDKEYVLASGLSNICSSSIPCTRERI